MLATTILALLSWAALAAEIPAAGGEGPKAEAGTVEFRINGEAFTREGIAAGVKEASALAPEICPTDEAAGFEMRRKRLIELVPVRQFLEREKVEVAAAEIDARIAAMKAEPNPFGVSPPKPMHQVMARQVMSMDDVRLMVRIELGLAKWAEREWRKKWPTDKEWSAYVAEKRAGIEEEAGRFSRIPFSLSRWPKGAKDEDEALAMLKEQAAAARKRIAAGEAFEDVAAEVRGVKKEALPAPAMVRYEILGEKTGAALREMPAGSVSEPLPSRSGWDLWRKEPLGDAEASAALKADFVAGLRAETLRRVAAEAKIEKVNWTEPGDGR
jgi:hypothetical protein